MRSSTVHDEGSGFARQGREERGVSSLKRITAKTCQAPPSEGHGRGLPERLGSYHVHENPAKRLHGGLCEPAATGRHGWHSLGTMIAITGAQ